MEEPSSVLMADLQPASTADPQAAVLMADPQAVSTADPTAVAASASASEVPYPSAVGSALASQSAARGRSEAQPAPDPRLAERRLLVAVS
jgi:hypothetical protein